MGAPRSKCEGPGAVLRDGVQGMGPGRRVACPVHRPVAVFSSLRGSSRKDSMAVDSASKSLNGPGQEIIRNPGQTLCCCDSCLIGRVGSLPPGHPRQHGVPSPCVPVPVLVAPSPTRQGVRRCRPGRTDRSRREAKSRGARCDSAVPFCLQTLTLGDR